MPFGNLNKYVGTSQGFSPKLAPMIKTKPPASTWKKLDYIPGTLTFPVAQGPVSESWWVPAFVMPLRMTESKATVWKTVWFESMCAAVPIPGSVWSEWVINSSSHLLSEERRNWIYCPNFAGCYMRDLLLSCLSKGTESTWYSIVPWKPLRTKTVV